MRTGGDSMGHLCGRRIGRFGLALVALIATGTGLQAGETPTSVAPSPPVTATRVAESILIPVVLEGVIVGGYSADGRWLLYAKPPAKGETVNQIGAYNVVTQERKNLGTVACRKIAEPPKRENDEQASKKSGNTVYKEIDSIKNEARVPIIATPDLRYVFLDNSSQYWEPATGKIVDIALPDSKSRRARLCNAVSGCSADGKHFALYEESHDHQHHLRVISCTDGKTVILVENIKSGGVNWVDNQLIGIGQGEIQLWPKRPGVLWKSILKPDDQYGNSFVGTVGQSALMFTSDAHNANKRICRWSPAEPDKLVELFPLQSNQQGLFDPVGERFLAIRVVLPAADAGDGSPLLELEAFDLNGKALFEKPRVVPFGSAIKDIEGRPDEPGKPPFASRLVFNQALITRGDRLLIRLATQNQPVAGGMGEFSNYSGTIALVEFGKKPQVLVNSKTPLMEWATGMAISKSWVSLNQDAGVCLVMYGPVNEKIKTVHLYRLP